MTDQVASIPSTPQKLSAEPGFISFDIFKPHYAHKIPLRTPGLLAFLFVEEDSECEMVIRLLLLDDLAKGYLENKPLCARANRAAYLVFPATDGCDERKGELAARLKVYAQLTEKYNAPQTSWPMGRFNAGPHDHR